MNSRVLEAATIYAGIVFLLSVVSLRQTGAGAGALATGQALTAQYYWTFLFGQSFIPAVNAVLLGTSTLFGLKEQMSTTSALMLSVLL